MKKVLIIPASGLGTRIESTKPKQYLKLKNGLTVIDTTIKALLEESFFNLVVVVINPKDLYWKESSFSKNKKILVCQGGKSRSLSVINALNKIKNLVQDYDWIFVHDAVLPCINLSDIQFLYSYIIKHKVIGGIFVQPIIDTVKYIDSQSGIIRTLSREKIYLSSTPQIFQYKYLIEAYDFCVKNRLEVTDESSAIEKLNYRFVAIKGCYKNIKITFNKDLDLVNYYLNNS